MNFKNCKYVGHDHKQVEYICIEKTCKISRFVCAICLKDDIHRHDKKQNSHIVNQDQFNKISLEKIDKLKQEQKQNQNQYSEFLKQVKTHFQQISDKIKLIINQIESLQKSSISQQDVTILENYIQISKYNDFNKLDEQLVQQIIKIENYQFNKKFHNDVKDGLDYINLMQNKLNNIVEKQLITGLKYELQDVCNTQESEIFSATISENFKYLICGGTDSILRIWNLEGNLYEQYNVQFESWIFISKFTKDSLLLYVGTQKGFLYQLDVLNNFEKIKNLQVHNDCILNIQLITNDIILSVSKEQYLIKTNFNSNQQIFKILAHQDRIDGIDYDFDNQVIVTCSDDTSIKLWDSHQGNLLFSAPDAHNNKKQIKQVVLQQHTRRLFSLDNYKNIKVWFIDLNNKCFQLQHSISDENLIFNLSLIFDQKYIIIVCRSYIKILDISGQCIQLINHDIQKFYMFKTIQPDSMNRIIIKGIQQLTMCQVFLD